MIIDIAFKFPFLYCAPHTPHILQLFFKPLRKNDMGKRRRWSAHIDVYIPYCIYTHTIHESEPPCFTDTDDLLCQMVSILMTDNWYIYIAIATFIRFWSFQPPICYNNYFIIKIIILGKKDKF